MTSQDSVNDEAKNEPVEAAVPVTSDTLAQDTEVLTNGAAIPATTESKKFPAKLILTIVILVIIGAVAYATMKDSALFSKPAATVNGAVITKIELENTSASIAQQMSAQGYPVEMESVQEQIKGDALNRLINTKLLVQAAETASYEATDEEIDTSIAELASQFGGEEAFAEYLKSTSLTDDMVRQDIREQILVDKYLVNETTLSSIEAEESEVAEFYEGLLEEYGEELPALVEIEAQITADIVAQKQQVALSEHLAMLRADADVVIPE